MTEPWNGNFVSSLWLEANFDAEMMKIYSSVIRQGDDVACNGFQDISQHQGHTATSVESKVEKMLLMEGLAFILASRHA